MDTMAKIISQDGGEITFAVDEVKPERDLLSTLPRKASLEQRLSREVTLLSEPDSGLVSLSDKPLDGVPQNHAFFETVYKAFNEHRPLVLRPDDFAILIAQGFSQHVNLRAEELRSRLVSHEGKHKVIVETDQWQSEGDWQLIIEALSSSVRAAVDPELQSALGCDFTTTTPAMRIAGEIALLDAFKSYFEYIAVGICGIPHVTLQGTPDDWRKLLASLDHLAGYKLDWWISRLRPIFEQLVASSEGNPDLRFWQAICKPKEVYGPEEITGWLSDLVPYIVWDDAFQIADKRNPVLEESRVNWALADGLRLSDFPSGISETEFTMVQFGVEKPLEFVGGFFGAEQNGKGALQASIGWAIASPNSIMKVISRIAAEHEGEPPLDSARHPGPAFLGAFQQQFSRVTLFARSDDPWILGEMTDVFFRLEPGLMESRAEDQVSAIPATVFAYSRSEEVLGFFHWDRGFEVVKGKVDNIAELIAVNDWNKRPRLLEPEILGVEITEAVDQLLDRKSGASVE